MNNRLVSLFLLISVIGCYEPSEGCLEFWATNYDVLADEPCMEATCCTQPKLSISLKYYKNDSTEYSFGDTLYHDPSDRYYSLLSSDLFTHSYSLYKENGSEVVTDQDSLLIKSMYYTNDFAFNTKQGSAINLTKYTKVFEFSQVDFVLGLPELLEDTTIYGADNKIVATAIDTLFNEINNPFFSTFSCNISLDTIDSRIIQCKSTLTDSIDISLNYPSNVSVNFGENSSMIAKIMVRDWINTIDDLDTDNSVIANQLAENLQNQIILE